jgi:Subtilase family/FG-GAP-like repeat
VRQGCLATIVVWLSLAGSAWASFPYEYEGTAPSDLEGKSEWMYAATPEQGNALVNADPRELGGVRGASVVDADPSVRTAWQTTTGRPDVTIAVLDSGIKWNDLGAMSDLRAKARLNRGELEQPLHDRSEPTEPGADCAGYGGGWDANGDGVFNVLDYACDSRVDAAPALGDGPLDGDRPVLDPQDVLIAFSDGADDDGNGFRDDIAGWDFLDDDSDPFDDVQYGHGTGEARDSTGEADNGGELGSCPNCTFIPLRVGDSFIADESDFAQAVFYATDNGVRVVQEALGTLDHTSLGRDAVEYAYRRGVAVIASAADEAAQHHNWPSNEPHTIVVNSVTKYKEGLTDQPRSYLQFNGCTNFSSKIAVAIPSVSCSSDATGRASGMAGLIYSAALDRGIELSANEVRQLMTGTADDVSFAARELSCSPVPADPCTDPNLNSVNPTRLVAPFPATVRYPARRGHDWFYGYGRINMASAVAEVADARIPPEAEITAPDWYSLVDPGRATLDVRGEVSARAGSYRCVLEVAPGSMPNNTDDFEAVSGGHCDGSERNGDFAGVLGSVDIAALKQRFPPSAGDFTGREPGATSGQSSNGRPNSEPYGFTLRLRVENGELRGEDRRNLFLHRDSDLLPGFPRSLASDGAASPAFADLDGDNRNELIVATADGTVHAYRPDGSEAQGWPVRGDALPLHTGGAAFASGAVSPDASRGAFLASPAVGDLDRDGVPEVAAADYEGRVYVWNADGTRRWTRRTRPEWSGRPLRPFDEARKGERNRTQRGFIGSPVLADLDGDGRLEVIAAAMDRHVYVWRPGGADLSGFPALVVDRSKVASIDPATHQVTFNEQAGASLMQGAIVDTPAVGDLNGDGRPEIVVGTNEEYAVNAPGEGGLNADNVEMRALEQAVGATGVLDPAHSRVYALDQHGEVLDGWPAKIGKLTAELLPIVGEGITGSPVIGPAECAGAGGVAVGAMPDAGLGYLLRPDGDSCLGSGADGKDRVVDTVPPAGVVQDSPAFPAVGHPAFGNFGGGVSFLAPAAGLRRALDAAVNEYQQGSQDFVGAWSTRDGRFRPGFPAVVNDLQFLTGPSVADLDGQGGEELLGGTASQDLYAVRADGRPLSQAWPKLTSDWLVANPLVGSFGEGGKVVIALTRLGTMLAYRTGAPACSPSSWPRFHHDEANSGDLRRDATPPGTPTGVRLDGRTVRFTSPGDDLLCGRPAAYEVSTGGPFQRAPTEPVAGGESAEIPLQGKPRSVSVRALDEQGNAGRTATAGR